MGSPLTALTVEELRRRSSLKWRAYPPDVLPLWVAEMDVPLAPAVVDAIIAAARTGDTGYPAGTAYAEALSDFAIQRWRWGFEVGQAALVADVMTGLMEMLALVTSPGDPVVVNPPVYPPFYGYLEHAGRRAVDAPLGAAGRIDLDALTEAFRAAVAGGGRAAYLLCNPQNPTGTAHTRDELAAVAGLAGEYGVRVVVDEIHAPIYRQGAVHTPYLSVPGAETGFSVMSASKAWNLAGLKAAVAVAGPGAVGDLARLHEMVSHGPSHVGIVAHVAGLTNGRDWLDDVLADLDRNRRLLGELLAKHLPEARYVEPAATYLAWLDCRGLGLGDDPAAVFLERSRVALNSGLPFGRGGAGHVRLNFATSPEILEQAITRLATAL